MKKSTKDILMKKNLGKIILLLLWLQASLLANNLASYSLSTTKQSAFLNEPIEITFSAQQKDHTNHMYFLVEPKKSPDYEIHLLKKVIDDKKYHTSKTEFRYILFPLKSGIITVDFDFTIQTASDSAVAQSFVEDHDDNVAIQMSNKKVKMKPLTLTIKKFTQQVDLIGDFTLKSQLNKKTTTAYEDISLIYTLQGKGYISNKLELLKSIKDVTLFSEKNDIYNRLTTGGYMINRKYIYALSSKKNFTIPAIVLQAYSPKKHQFYTLKTPKYDIVVNAIDTKTLLDTKEAPSSKEFINSTAIKQFFIYTLIFIAGYISAKLGESTLFGRKKEKRLDDIRTASSPKELILLLLNKYATSDISRYIKDLETLEYQKETTLSFNKIKKSILENL